MQGLVIRDFIHIQFSLFKRTSITEFIMIRLDLIRRDMCISTLFSLSAEFETTCFTFPFVFFHMLACLSLSSIRNHLLHFVLLMVLLSQVFMSYTSFRPMANHSTSMAFTIVNFLSIPSRSVVPTTMMPLTIAIIVSPILITALVL